MCSAPTWFGGYSIHRTAAPALIALILLFALSGIWQAAASANQFGSALEQGFVHPPESARPWVYWFWLNGNITSNGITADLEAMKRVGIGGVLIMEVDQGTPRGTAAFGGPVWRNLFKHVCSEAHRLRLEVNMNNDAGWCGSGGPWITPELAMQKLVWTETNVSGPNSFSGKLARAPAVANYYGDIALFAFPTPAGEQHIEKIQAKAAFTPEHVIPTRDAVCPPADAILARERILNLTAQLKPDGSFAWKVPSGRWTILRLGHTPTGKDNHPAPNAGRGLESDKLSRAATDAMFVGLMGKLIADSKPLAGNTLVATHIDSWETGSQNWTPEFRQQFRRLRGYDPMPLFPVMTGRIVESLEVSERFLWDVRQTVSDLLIENYAERMGNLARKNGLRLSIEAYDGAPCDEMTYAGRADEPMAEFWSWGYNAAYSCTEMTSAAHVYGKRIIGAEAFTATDGEKWQLHPAAIKALGDWAFCEGINRFVFHRYALQPWDNLPPGMSMGPWGLHYERTQTWWEQSAAWHEYLARCQFMLRQGLFVADLCYLQPEGSPQRFTLSRPGGTGNTPARGAYDFDGCTPEVVLNRMKVADGRLVLPDGMSYRLLVLPQVETMTPKLLRKIEELVRAGATVVGSPPAKSPSLAEYPKCDAEVAKLARELWGEPQTTPVAERKVGKGRVIFGADFVTEETGGSKETNPVRGARWIWYPEGNPAASAPVGQRYFRRTVDIGSTQKVVSARMAITADNAFELWINGKRVGSGDNFKDLYKFDAANLLRPGANVIAVAAENQSDKPNPAGLLAALTIRFADGTVLDVDSDHKWQSAITPSDGWINGAEPALEWKAAMDLGPFAMAPWNISDEPPRPAYEFPPYRAVTNLLMKMNVPPDFDSADKFRYIHRRSGETDIYFVSNPASNWVSASCAFRVTGKTPELWCPISGTVKKQLVYEKRDGRTIVPLCLEPSGSMFVVFRNSETSGSARIVNLRRNDMRMAPEAVAAETEPAIETCAAPGGSRVLAWQGGRYTWMNERAQIGHVDVPDLPAPTEIRGPWEVQFQPHRGAPEKLSLDKLADWAQYPDAGVKHFSGLATYTITFKVPADSLRSDSRLFLDLGKVAVIAQLRVNGMQFGTLWKAPYRADITSALHAGDNQLEVKVVNLWINRMIGDEQLAEDSARNPGGTLKEWPQWVNESKPSPTGRYTFTSWRLWKKDSPLQESGLIGPVRLITAKQVELKN